MIADLSRYKTSERITFYEEPLVYLKLFSWRGIDDENRRVIKLQQHLGICYEQSGLIWLLRRRYHSSNYLNHSNEGIGGSFNHGVNR